jgi:hypothetical protein
MHLPSPAEIAHQDARRLALVLREIGGDGAPVGSGWMACDIPGSWASYAAGLGLDGPVSPSTLKAMIAFYREKARLPRVDVTPFQHPTLRTGLDGLGFRCSSEETVLARSLEQSPKTDSPAGLSFRRIDPRDNQDVASFVASQKLGFYGDECAPEGITPITQRVARHPRCHLWLLEMDHHVVGSGGLEVFEDSGVLIAACTHPDVRRQGVQSAFIRFRVQRSAELGLRYVSIASTPNGATERNARRAGFTPVYTQRTLELSGRLSTERT